MADQNASSARISSRLAFWRGGDIRLRRLLALHIAFIAAYVVLFQISSVFRTAEIHASPWHPEVGVAAIAGAVLGPSAILSIAVAHFVSDLVWSEPQYTVLRLGTSVITAAVYVGGVHLLRHRRWRDAESPLRSVQNFLVYAAVTAAALAVLRLILFTQVYQIALVYYLPYALTNAVGNMIGILTVVPLYMAFGSLAEWRSYIRRLSIISVLALLACVAASFVVFALPWTDEFRFFYLLFPPVVMLAVKDGFPGAIIGVLLSDLMMIGILFTLSYEPWTLTELQIFMITLGICGIVLGAAISERQQYSRRLLESAAALQESQSSLLQASRLTLANAVAAALAHEINQPLTSARNYVRAVSLRLKKPLRDREQLGMQIGLAVQEIDRAAAMIKSTREFLSRGERPLTVLSANGLLESCAELAMLVLKQDGIQIDLALWSREILVKGHRLQLQQVILSLIRNSQEAMAGQASRTKRICLSVTPVARPGFAEISIADTGPGIAPGVRPRLFIPLQSQKPEGLGIGLSVAKAIISAHGGEIWLDENFVHGARFTFTLPLVYDENPAQD